LFIAHFTYGFEQLEVLFLFFNKPISEDIDIISAHISLIIGKSAIKKVNKFTLILTATAAGVILLQLL